MPRRCRCLPATVKRIRRRGNRGRSPGLARVFHPRKWLAFDRALDMDLMELTAIVLILGGGAAALAPKVRALRTRRHLQVVDATIACPRTGKTVRCELELNGRTQSYEGILRCSARERDRRPSCDQTCVDVLNMGIPLRPLGSPPRSSDDLQSLEGDET